MSINATQVLTALRAANYAVPPDCTAIPALWPHQIPNLRMADVVWALHLEASPASLAVLQTLLPNVKVIPSLGAPKPIMTTRKLNLPSIHLQVHTNPHPPDTSLYRNWHRYRENLPVDVYHRLGGSTRILEGDVRRGLVRVA